MDEGDIVDEVDSMAVDEFEAREEAEILGRRV